MLVSTFDACQFFSCLSRPRSSDLCLSKSAENLNRVFSKRPIFQVWSVQLEFWLPPKCVCLVLDLSVVSVSWSKSLKMSHLKSFLWLVILFLCRYFLVICCLIEINCYDVIPSNSLLQLIIIFCSF